MASHTVEKIGGTSMANTKAVLDNVLLTEAARADPYGRIIVVSAYAGITDKLLGHKKTGKPGVYALYTRSELERSWEDALSSVCNMMCSMNASRFRNAERRGQADDFVLERIEGVRRCLLDLQRLCSYGHFKLDEHLLTVREMLCAIGEAHSAFSTALLLEERGIEARFVDLTGWRDERELDLGERIDIGLDDVDIERQLAIVTGYAQCRGGLVHRYGRGYSEVTFSHLAARTAAREAIIHKEYHLSSADPTSVGVERVRKIGDTNYDVADQLSNMGMEAIHPSAAKVLRQAGITLRIRNTFEPEDPGTTIRNDYVSATPCVEIICGCKGLFAVKVFDQDATGLAELDRSILEIIVAEGLSLVTKDINANSVTHFVAGTLSRSRRAIKQLETLFPNGEIGLQRVALVSVIGSDLSVPGLLANVVSSLAKADIEVIALHQGIRQVDIQVVVNESEYDEAVRTLHAELIEDRATTAPSDTSRERPRNVA
jgi:aspartate kinase